MKKSITLLFVLLLFHIYKPAHAQSTITSKIIDASTREPIPYVTILLANKKGVISNEEGTFSLQLNETTKNTDSLFISCMGYETIGKPLSEFTGDTVVLRPKAIELNDVFVSNKNYTAEEVIDKVKENLDKNYENELSRRRIFLRQSDFQNFAKKNYTLKKSSIPELNKEFLDSMLNAVPNEFEYYSEILCDFYSYYQKDRQKIKLIKATELYDKKNEIGFKPLEEKFNKILENRIKPDSYLKIKSGWFGTKVEADEVVKTNRDNETEQLKSELKDKEKERKNFAEYRRKTISGLIKNLFFMDGADLNFIYKSRKYEFNISNYSYINDLPVYVINFTPKGNADYKGILYVNMNDFAVLRAEYVNVKSIRKFNLLGITYNKYLERGKLIFSKKENDAKYSLLFLEQKTGQDFGFRRPLKIVEKNKNVKGRRKQNELLLELDMATTLESKFELIVFDKKKITTADFESLQEKNEQLPTYMPAYDPDFWKGYTIIEPNQAIKEFTAENHKGYPAKK